MRIHFEIVTILYRHLKSIAQRAARAPSKRNQTESATKNKEGSGLERRAKRGWRLKRGMGREAGRKMQSHAAQCETPHYVTGEDIF